jgi:hypothetical protein
MTTNEIPHTLGPKCHQITAEQVARMSDRGALLAKAEPGVCRFCLKKLPYAHMPLEMPSGVVQMPVLQCDRVAGLAEEAARISERWSLDRMRNAAEKAKHTAKKELW